MISFFLFYHLTQLGDVTKYDVLSLRIIKFKSIILRGRCYGKWYEWF